MSILVRRISMGKWRDYCKSATIRFPFFRRILKTPFYNAPADAITKCLKTNNNQLSMWLLSDDNKLNDVLLALCTGTKANAPSSFDYILIDTTELDSLGLTYEKSEVDADTAIPHLKSLHYDVSGFDYYKLGHFQDLIVKRIQKGKSEHKNASELKPLVLDALQHGKFDFACLSEEYKTYLKHTFPDEKKINDIECNSVICPNCGAVVY